MTTSRDELTTDDLLGDPLTHAIMKADRVDPSELEAMLRTLAARIADLAGRSSGDALDAEGPRPRRFEYDCPLLPGLTELDCRDTEPLRSH